MIDRGQKIDEVSNIEEGGTDGVSSTVVVKLVNKK